VKGEEWGKRAAVQLSHRAGPQRRHTHRRLVCGCVRETETDRCSVRVELHIAILRFVLSDVHWTKCIYSSHSDYLHCSSKRYVLISSFPLRFQ